MKEFKVSRPGVCCKCGHSDTENDHEIWGFQDPGQGHDTDVTGIFYCPKCGQSHFEITTSSNVFWREC